MYELDKSVDLSFLKSKEVIQVCIGNYQSILHLTDNVTITIESSCELTNSDGLSDVLVSINPSDMAKITVLLGGSVTESRVIGSGNLHLEFSHGYTLTIRNSSEHAESYSICARDHNIVV